MPLFVKSALITALVSIPIFGTAIIGANYSSVILHHLVDVVNGGNTQTVVSLNAPNWSSGIPITPPLITSAATSAVGSLASSTAFTLEVAAIDGTGTTTLVSQTTVTTDASSTLTPGEGVLLKWTPVNGATGYAVFFATSTSVGSGLGQYFYATTSGQYIFSTSTGSLPGSYLNPDTTAFSERINPQGTDIFNDNLNGATSSPVASTTAVQINGTAVIITSATTTACEADTAGAIFFNQANAHEWGCSGTAWVKIF